MKEKNQFVLSVVVTVLSVVVGSFSVVVAVFIRGGHCLYPWW